MYLILFQKNYYKMTIVIYEMLYVNDHQPRVRTVVYTVVGKWWVQEA